MNLKEAWAREEVVAELETIGCLLKESPPKVRNASYQLGQLTKKTELEKPELEEIMALLKHNPPKVMSASYRLHLLIKRLAREEVVNDNNPN